jgi:hypothetical protein
MSKYQRYQPAITPNSNQAISEDHWLKEFEKTLEKGAVQSKTQQSLFEQINSIMNRSSRYSSVEAAVDDMKERSGLKAYLDKVKQSEMEDASLTKMAADQEQTDQSKVPIVIQKCPTVLKTLQNCIRDTKGNLPIPAIIERVRSIHQNDVSDASDWDDDKLMYLASQLNLDAKKNNPGSYEDFSNLGGRDSASDSQIDPSNTDAFFALNPAKV